MSTATFTQTLGKLFGTVTQYLHTPTPANRSFHARYDVDNHGIALPDVADFPEFSGTSKYPAGTAIECELKKSFDESIRQNDTAAFFAALEQLQIEIEGHAEFSEEAKAILHRQLQNTRAMGKWYLNYKLDWSNFDRSDIAPNEAYDSLIADGVCCRHIDVSSINDILTGEIDRLLNTEVSGVCRPGQGYDRSQTFLNNGEHEALFASLRSELTAKGMLRAAAKYHNCADLDFKHACLHICKPGDTHFTQTLQDCTTTSQLIGLHIDPKPVMKVIVYLNEVNDASGPFSFVLGSHRWRFDEVEMLFAKGNSTGNYLHTPLHRWVAAQFPPSFRKNSIIGRFILDGTPQSKKLLAAEHRFTSDSGNCMLFDPGNGLHRGGICSSGNRINLQIVLH